jgi:hypothetical protein
MMIGAAAGLILFGVFGLLPSFRFGSYLALFILHKTSGKLVEPVAGARAFILAVALFCIACGTVLSLVLGALLGSLVLR